MAARERFDLASLEPRLKRLARAMLLDDSSADDLVQDVWLASLEVVPSDFEDGEAWLRAVARNLAKGERRARARRSAREQRAARPERLDVDLTLGLQREALRQRLAHAVDELDEPYATVVRDHYLGGRTVKEVATELGRPPSTIKTQLSRGIARLRAKLGPEFGEGRAFSLALIGAFDWDRSEVRSAALGGGTAAAAGGLFAFWPAAVAAAALAGLLVLRGLLGGDAAPAEAALTGVDARVAAPEGARDAAQSLAEDEAGDSGPREAVAGRPAEMEGQVSPQASPEEPEPASTDPLLATVPVRVIDHLLTLVPGAEVWIGWGDSARLGTRLGAGGDGRVELRASDFDAGRFNELRGVPIVARAPGHADSWVHLLDPASETTPLLILKLQGPGLEVTGVVTGPGGSPVEGALVTELRRNGSPGRNPEMVRTHNRARTAVTDARGTFRMRGLERQAQTLQVTHPDFAAGGAAVSGGGGAAESVDVSLSRGALLSGQVVDGSGAPAPGARLVFRPAYRGLLSRMGARADEEGRFAFQRLPAGRGSLQAIVDGAEGAIDVALVDGEDYEARVELKTVAVLDLTLVDGEGRPVEGGLAYAETLSRDWSDQGAVDGAGRARLQGLPAAPIRLMVLREDRRRPFPIAWRTIDGATTRELEITCDLEAGADDRIHGALQLAVGPLPGGTKVRVTHLQSGLGVRYLVEPGSGRFLIPDAVPGRYELIAVVPDAGRYRLGAFDFSEGDLDLGSLTLPPLARLSIDWRWPEGGEPMRYRLQRFGAGGRGAGNATIVVGSGAPQDEWRVFPGGYAVVVERPDGTIAQVRQLTLRPGHAQTLVSGPGAPTTISVDYAVEGESVETVQLDVVRVDDNHFPLPPGTTEADLEVLAEDGVREQALSAAADALGMHRFDVSVAEPGAWILVATTSDGRVLHRWARAERLDSSAAFSYSFPPK